MATKTYYLSFGRNIGKYGSSMSYGDWSAMNIALAGVVEDSGCKIIATTDGQGEYEGVKEQCGIIVFTPLQGEEIETGKAISLKEDLETIARNYGQECFALTSGVPSFIGEK